MSKILYQEETAKALKNFPITFQPFHRQLAYDLALVKIACAQANAKTGALSKPIAAAIIKAAREIIAGQHDDQLVVDQIQGGAGTSMNMNINEVIAARATQILKGKIRVHYLDHVNKAQSTNDVVPTAMKITALKLLNDLIIVYQQLINQTQAKAQEFKNVIKVGRTHLQDAVPITLGEEFMAYATAIKNELAAVKDATEDLKKLGIGGTAIGTGINAPPKFKEAVIPEISKIVGIKFSKAPNSITTTHSLQAFTRFSSTLRNFANEMFRIMGDLRLMSAGPRAGLREIKLPKVQPGSSIMPAKLNPSIPECMSMICGQVIGIDSIVSFAAQGGQFELNWYTPLIMPNLIMAVNILTNGLKTTREKCIDGLEACEDVIAESFKKSLCTATLLVPKLGYHEVARLVKIAMKTGRNLEEVVKEEVGEVGEV